MARPFRFTVDPVLKLNDHQRIVVSLSKSPVKITKALLIDNAPPGRPFRRNGYVVGYWAHSVPLSSISARRNPGAAR